MGLFEKKISIFEKKDRETWKKVKDALKESGIKHVSAGHIPNDVVAENGMSGMVDPRDFGMGKRIDRDLYYIRVRESDVEKAQEIIRSRGLVSKVDKEDLMDAAKRKENIRKVKGE